ncbi:MAG: PEP-CTERM sorting domain-containing protein [Aquabacterium sp.]|nr:PEP-CTERM sorting domain-containing protein [Aquabacterium sp.]
MKKFATTALSLLILGAVSLAHAAPVVVDAGTYTLTYDSSFLGFAPTVSVSGDAVSFSGGTMSVNAVGNDDQSASFALDSYNGNPFPIFLSAKAGYKIAGLSETLSGSYDVDVSVGSVQSGAGFVSYWVSGGVVQGNSGSKLLADTTSASVNGDYAASSAFSFASPTQLASLSAISLASFAKTTGDGVAFVSANKYSVNVQTTAVPEPETVTLMLAGLGVACFRTSRNRRA